jgi:pimeloyl-ACP methyl ester carboxylesterase
MVGLEAMRRIDPDAVVIEGAGHNAHYETPDQVWELIL